VWRERENQTMRSIGNHQSNPNPDLPDRELLYSPTFSPDSLTDFSGAETLPAPRQLRRLLVPLDGSPESERTLPYASELAGLLHARLLLGHVTPTADAGGLGQVLHLPGSIREAEQQAFGPRAMPYLQDLRWRLTTPVDQVETLHIDAPSVVAGLLQMATASEADLVILGLRTHMSGDRMSLGNVVDSLIRRGSIPLLVIPPTVEAGSRLFTLRHILVPLDGSALAEEALAPLLGMLRETQGNPGAPLMVTLLGVAKAPADVPGIQRYLDRLRSVLMEMPTCAHAQVRVEARPPASAPGRIVARISPRGGASDMSGGGLEDEPVDLLIMATHGRGGVGRFLFGSVADYVLPRVPIPVLLVHPTYLNS
jgi:nucleotide-binding universal stress UspA family protein